MEKIFVYEDVQSIRQSIKWCETVATHLQELADDLTKTDIVPTIEKLESLYNRSNLWDLINESCENQRISMIPKRLQNTLRKDMANELDKIKEKAANLLHSDVNPIEWEFYLVNNGKVEIIVGYKQILTDRYRIYIDTDTRSAVYEKWLAMEKAIKEFNQAVKEAPKVSTFYDSLVKANHPSADAYNPQYIMGLAVPDRFSLARLDPDGSVVLKGKNFEYIK